MRSSLSPYLALVDIAKDAVHRIDAHVIAGQLVRGTMSEPLYVAYLTQVVHQVRESAPILETASRQLERRGRTKLASLMGAKSGEETGHDRWALEDLVALGIDAAAVEASPPSRAVEAYVAWGRYCAEHAPLGVFGLAWVLEWFGYTRAGRAADRLVSNSGIRNIGNAVRFLRGHGDADRGHVEVLAAALAEITDPAEAESVVLSARVTATLYLGFFEPVQDRVPHSRYGQAAP